MPDDGKGKDKPYWVVLKSNKSFVAGWEDIRQADLDAADRNKRAEEMGIKARYEMVPREA
jgi:hypothetical protein